MADQICSGDRSLIKGFCFSLLPAALVCVSAGSEGMCIDSNLLSLVSRGSAGRGLDARLWRSEFGSRIEQSVAREKKVVEEKPAFLNEESDLSGASNEKNIHSEPSLRSSLKASDQRQHEPALKSEDIGQTAPDAGLAQVRRQAELRKGVTEEKALLEGNDELSPLEKDSRSINEKQKTMESKERAGLGSGQPREFSDVVALEKLNSSETAKIKPPRHQPESDSVLAPELSLESVTTAITMNDVHSSESGQTDDVYESDSSAVQGSIATVSDWDRAAADSMRSSAETGAKGPSLTTYLVGIAALIVVGGAVLSPR